MFRKKYIWSSLVSLGLLLGLAQIATAESPGTESEPTSQFSRIEQPLSRKIGVTLGGLALIGVEIWWFIFSKTKAQSAQTHQGVQELDITVDGGYMPDRIVVQAGQPVRLNFFRQDPSSCLEKVLLPDFHKAVDLLVNQTTSVEFTPEKPGIYTFHCGMNMFRGVVEVRADGRVGRNREPPQSISSSKGHKQEHSEVKLLS
ncbi:cupredoxin domain-containing protein [Moorena producens]|uniref:cupredoxin domain-containing protein n=1 Tax=Moorena producens TaxID=1155739 RepID=UPI0009F2FC21|nr:cupredoxin domain-containing protein [Moorena producens]